MGPRTELTKAFTGMRKDNDVSGLRMLFPVLALIGTCSLAGCSASGLAAEDEPYLFDTSDPSFHLATPCEDITEEQLAQLGLEHSDAEKHFSKVEGRDDCAFVTENFDSILVSGSAYKLAVLERDGVPLPYQASEDKAPYLAYSQTGHMGCSVAAETPRGTVEVMFTTMAVPRVEPLEDCPNAEKYFDLFIGEKLNEYRAH